MVVLIEQCDACTALMRDQLQPELVTVAHVHLMHHMPARQHQLVSLWSSDPQVFDRVVVMLADIRQGVVLATAIDAVVHELVPGQVEAAGERRDPAGAERAMVVGA
ncbi:hypothetical protein D3C78_1214640 [compost metagenome]